MKWALLHFHSEVHKTTATFKIRKAFVVLFKNLFILKFSSVLQKQHHRICNHLFLCGCKVMLRQITHLQIGPAQAVWSERQL